MKEKSLTFASIIAAFAASLCCLGPLILSGVGLGTALAGFFAPLRPYFLGASAILLGAGFYFVYRRPKLTEACEGEVCAPDSRARKLAKPMLWVATLTVLALAFFPSYGAKLVSAYPTSTVAAPAHIETAQLKITGMDCPVCAGLIQKKLSEMSGVIRAQVRYPAGTASVDYDPAKIASAQIVRAVNATGYKAALAN